MVCYLHLIMEYFADNFDFIADGGGGGGSKSFICTKAISNAQAEEAANSYFDLETRTRLYEKLLSGIENKWKPHSRLHSFTFYKRMEISSGPSQRFRSVQNMTTAERHRIGNVYCKHKYYQLSRKLLVKS